MAVAQTDPNTCDGVFKLVPNATHTAFTFSLIYRNRTFATLSQPVLDKSGNIFITYFPAFNNPAPPSIIEISPPAVPGGEWGHKVIWHATKGQFSYAVAILVGPDGNLLATARGRPGDGVFKLLRPATQTGEWTYRPVWQGVTNGGDQGVGAGPGTPIIDKTVVVFYQGFRDVVSLTPPDTLGHPWVAKEVFSKSGYDDYYGGLLTPDAAGELLFDGNYGQIFALEGSGFVPQQSGK